MKLQEIIQIVEGVKTEGTYVAVKYDAEDSGKLFDYYSTFDIPNMLPAKDYHTTIAFSKTKFEPSIVDDVSDVKPVTPFEHEIFKSNGGANCLVLKIQSKWLHEQFQDCMSKGASYDYDEYKPHITISYDIGDLDIKDIKVPSQTLQIVSEYTESLEIGKYD